MVNVRLINRVKDIKDLTIQFSTMFPQIGNPVVDARRMQIRELLLRELEEILLMMDRESLSFIVNELKAEMNQMLFGMQIISL